MTTDAAAVSEFKDRRTGLIVFGILEILLGIFCALAVPLMILGVVISARTGQTAPPPPTFATISPGIAVYTLAAVWCVWMGIGSILARRWARALWLIVSWAWLAAGIGGLIAVLVFMPGLFDQMQAGAGQPMPPQAFIVVKAITVGFLALFYIVLPGALVLFYGSRHVKATCAWRDPKPRWTDRCPLPVLAISLLSGFWAACGFFAGFYGWATPFFGTILTGGAGAAATLLVMLIMGYTAWAAYRLRIEAWWLAVGLVAAWGVSAVTTFSRVDLMEFYERMSFPPDQMELLRQSPVMETQSVIALSALWVAAALIYLAFTKKYFAPPPPPPVKAA